MKIFIIIVITALVAAGIAVPIALKATGGEEEAPAVRIELAARGDLSEIVSAPGTVEPKTKVSISAKTTARIVELPLEEGAAVKKGDVLIKLDSRELEAQLRAAEARYAAQKAQISVAEARVLQQEAQVESSRIQLADAARELKRQTNLLSSSDVSAQAVEQAQTKFDQMTSELSATTRGIEAQRADVTAMRHQLDAADAEIAQVRENLSYTTIPSPIDGTVTRVNVKVGELVVIGTMNNPGTVILEVADLSQMLVVARIDEASISTLEKGQLSKVRSQAYAGETFTGSVHTVALAETEEKDGSKFYKVEILLETNGRRIPSGLSADVEIQSRKHPNVMKVPSQAILGRPIDDLPQDIRDKPEVDKSKALATVVYRFIDGKAVATPVKISRSDLTHTIIDSGISEGDPVIVGPYKVLDGLAHDKKVRDEKTVTTQPTDTKKK